MSTFIFRPSGRSSPRLTQTKAAISLKVSECFLVCDVTNWILSPDEMVKVISDQMGDQMEQAKAVIDQLDVDKDGKVSYPEFILVMKYKK